MNRMKFKTKENWSSEDIGELYYLYDKYKIQARKLQLMKASMPHVQLTSLDLSTIALNPQITSEEVIATSPARSPVRMKY